MCVSTRCEREKRRPGGAASPSGEPDPVEEVALVASAKRAVLLRAHGYRLRREDLEDCYSQATLELLTQARRGRRFVSRRHIANALEQRFVSRVHDRRRALAGRSPMQAAIEGAVPLHGPLAGEIAIVDRRAEIERLVLLRHELARIPALSSQLTPAQRLVLASQVALQMPASEFCLRYGWSSERYRKVAQRARARLRVLLRSEEQEPVPGSAKGSEEKAGTRP